MWYRDEHFKDRWFFKKSYKIQFLLQRQKSPDLKRSQAKESEKNEAKIWGVLGHFQIFIFLFLKIGADFSREHFKDRFENPPNRSVLKIKYRTIL